MTLTGRGRTGPARRAALSWAVVGAVALGGLASLLWAATNLPGDRLGEVALFFLLAAVSQRMPIPLFRNSSISVGFAIGFGALIALGPAAAILVQLGPGLVLCVTPRVKPLQKMLFNAGSLPLETALAAAVYAGLGGTTRIAHLDAAVLGPTVASAIAFVALNTGMLAAVIALETGASVRAIWTLNYRWLLPNYVGLGLLGLVMGVAAGAVGPTGWLVFAVPLAMAYYSFKLYMVPALQVRRRNEELRAGNARLDLASERLSQRVTELRALDGIGLTLNEALDLGNVLGDIVESALGLVPVRAAAIALADPRTGRLGLAASIGLPPGAAATLVASDGPVARAIGAAAETVLAGATEAEDGTLLVLSLPAGGAASGALAVTFAPGHDLGADERLLLSTLAQQAATAVHNARLYREIEAGYLSTVQAMVQVTDARERYAAGHAERVRAYCAAAAGALRLDAARTGTLELAALFHDLGHVGVPETVLGKPGALTAEEWALVRRHPLLGVSILKQVPRMEAVVPVILQHHERYDGQGYPAGLLGDDASVLAQVLAVADAYEAMTSARPHRPAMSRAQAVAELRAHSGTQFAPRVVEAFIGATEAAVQTAPSAEHSLLRLLRTAPATVAIG
jgi:hypothetical protein